MRTPQRRGAGVRRRARTDRGATACRRLMMASGVRDDRSLTWVAVMASIIFPPVLLLAARKSWANWRNEACASAMASTWVAMDRTSHSSQTVGRSQCSRDRLRNWATVCANSASASFIASRCLRGAATPASIIAVSITVAPHISRYASVFRTLLGLSHYHRLRSRGDFDYPCRYRPPRSPPRSPRRDQAGDPRRGVADGAG